MIIEVSAIAIIIAGSLLLLLRWPVSYALVLAAQLSLREIGLVANSSAGIFPVEPTYLFAASILTVLFAHAIGSRVGRARRAWQLPTKTAVGDFASVKAWPDRSVMAVVLAAGGLAFYHIAIVGPPIFASDIEVSRFDFTSSGFFGIPGRMYLFGTTFAWIIASANAQALGRRWRTYTPWKMATGILLILALLSGFKGELLATAVVLMCTYVVISGRTLRLGTLIIRYWWALVPPVAYFLLVAGLYQTYASSGKSTLQLTWERLTVVAAEPTQFALTYFDSFDGGLASDFAYFLTKYVGQSVAGRYTFERAVSAAILNIAPESSAWAPPVTVGGFAESAAFFGVPAALSAMAMCGFILGWLTTLRVYSATRLTIAAVVSWAIYTWMLKGGLAYHVLNFSIVLLMLLSIAWIASMLSSTARRFRPVLPVGAHKIGSVP